MRKILLLTLGVGLMSICAAAYHSQTRQDEYSRTHLTIYLEPPLLDEGGSIVVAGIPVPDEEWQAIANGPNPANDDSANPKTRDVQPSDRHFGAVVSSPASAVEFRYPESGSYTFNLRIHPNHGARDDLQTKQILVGSGNTIDPETGERLEWPSQAVIHIVGPKRDEEWARLMAFTFKRAFSRGEPDDVSVSRFEGVRILSLSDDAIERFVVDTQ